MFECFLANFQIFLEKKTFEAMNIYIHYVTTIPCETFLKQVILPLLNIKLQYKLNRRLHILEKLGTMPKYTRINGMDDHQQLTSQECLIFKPLWRMDILKHNNDH